MNEAQNRILKEPSAAPSARQVKTLPGKSVTVVFYSEKDNKELFRAEIPAPIFAAVQRACKKLHIGLSQFFHLAVESKFGHAVPALRQTGRAQ